MCECIYKYMYEHVCFICVSGMCVGVCMGMCVGDVCGRVYGRVYGHVWQCEGMSECYIM